jgi:hypothetical protein
MSFRALNTDFEEVIIIDLFPEEERRQYCVSEELKSDLANLGIRQFQLSCSNKTGVFETEPFFRSALGGPTVTFNGGPRCEIINSKSNLRVKWSSRRYLFGGLSRKRRGRGAGFALVRRAPAGEEDVTYVARKIGF